MEGKKEGHVVDLVLSLIEAAFDKNDDVRDDITSALHNLGRHQSELVLSQCNMYLNQQQKLAQGHRILLLDIMIKIVKDAGSSLSLDLSKELIILASSELTKSKEIITEWQTSASNLLVALGINFSQEVMAEMLQKIVPGTLPHYFVVYTLANLAKENVFGVVPFLKDIFSRILPMLGLAKLDNIRWAFATCIGAFSEAILDYCANIENAPYPDIAKDRFYGEIFTAFEMMFTVWLTSSKEAKVRLAIVEALGHMAHLMSEDKLEEFIQRILVGITSLYKRHTEHYTLTQALCMVLNAACVDGSMMLLPQLDQMLNGLHLQASNEPDYNNLQAVKNHNELLRCFQVLAQSFSEKLVTFLQMKLDTGNINSRAATLSILKHLINSSDMYLQDKKEVILAGMSMVLQENHLKVCRAFSQCIIAMAHHDYLGLEGGEKMIQFIVRMCSLSEDDKQAKRIIETERITLAAIKAMCQNVLHLMSTTVEAVDNVLWPYLLEFLLPGEYTPAVMTVCRSLANIATRKREEDDEAFIINLQVHVNVPKSQALFARLVVLTGCPLKDGRGIHILTFLKSYSPNIHPSIVGMWDTVVSKLIIYLEENSYDEENWNQKAWEDLILKLLAKTLSEIDSEEWFLSLGKELGLQLPLYSGRADEKNFLYKCLGVLLRKIGTTDFIREYLDVLFVDVDHTNQIEKEGCAVSIGFCAASHLDQCLKKLEEVTKTQMVRKSTGFMGLIKDKSEADVERIKSTVMLCYGYVVFYGPSSLISSRLESNVLRVMNPHFAIVRDSGVKQSLIKAVELIGRALQPNHMQNDDFVFARRGELLAHMQSFLNSESKVCPSENRPVIIKAITNFVKLEPPLEENLLKDIVDICASNVYPIPISASQPAVKGKDAAPVEDKQEKYANDALESLNILLKEMCRRDPTPKTLQSIVQNIESYMTSSQDQERDRVMSTIKVVLQNYLDNVNITGGNHFSTLGYILGRLLPRCTDSVTDVRQNSMDCVQILLTINDRYEGVPPNINDERIQALTVLRENLSKSDPNILFNVVNELSMVVSKKTPDEQVKTLVFSLSDGLRDRHWQSSSGACAILNCLMKFRGAELKNEVPKIVEDIVENLESVSYNQTITGSLVALRTLASHHLVKVLEAFLNFPVPLKLTVSEFWKTLARDKDLLVDTFEHLLDLLHRTSPYTDQQDDHRDSSSIRLATPLPVSITAAFTEIFKVQESEPLILNMFAKLLSAILLRMGSSVGLTVMSQEVKDPKAKKKDVPASSAPSPLRFSINCFKEFISNSKINFIKQASEDQGAWSLFEEEETFASGLQIVVVAICEHQPTSVNDLVSSLLPCLSCPYDSQRMVAAAIFAELIKQRCCGDMQLVELLMNSLLSKLVDPSHLVRKLCIRGLGNVASVGGQKLQTYSTTILSAMMAGMDDQEDLEMAITLEAMSGFSRILELLNESDVRQILINICLRIRPCFEKDSADVRAAAISLFGNLARFGEGPSETAFSEQIHANLVSILLHLNEETNVTKACKGALRSLGSLLGSTTINEMFQKHLIEDRNLHYGEFMNDLSRLMIADYLDKMNFYVMGCVSFFKSNWSDIRANAALFVGFLLGNLKKDQRGNISVDHICNALVVLLKDPEPSVRSRAAEAISLLHDY